MSDLRPMNEFVWFVIAGVAIFGAALFKIVKYRGVKAAMFGAQLVGTVGEVTIKANPFNEGCSVKVHRLKSPNASSEPYVGVEIASSWEVPPVVLTRAQAQRLSELLSKAAE